MGRDWTDKLRERMQDYKEPEPEGLWEAISGSLDKAVQPGRQTGARTPREKRKNIFIISSLAAAAAVLLVVYFSFPNPDTSAVRTMHYTALADNGGNAVLVDYRPERPAPPSAPSRTGSMSTRTASASTRAPSWDSSPPKTRSTA